MPRAVATGGGDPSKAIEAHELEAMRFRFDKLIGDRGTLRASVKERSAPARYATLTAHERALLREDKRDLKGRHKRSEPKNPGKPEALDEAVQRFEKSVERSARKRGARLAKWAAKFAADMPAVVPPTTEPNATEKEPAWVKPADEAEVIPIHRPRRPRAWSVSSYLDDDDD